MCDRALGGSVLVAAAALFATSMSAQGGPLRPVALTGTSGPLGPNLGPGVTFTNMVLNKTVHPEYGTTVPSGPSISGSGSIVFGANIAGPGISTSNGSGIWAARGGSSLSLVARRGSSIPGMPPSYTFGELFTVPQISDANTVAFQSMIDGPDTSITQDEGMFSEKSGWVLPVVLEGRTIVPETGGLGYFGSGSSNPGGDPWGNNQWVQNRRGDIALRCFVNAPSTGVNSGFGVYTDATGALTKHYRGGDTCVTNGTTYTFAGCSNPRLNDSGAILTARLAGDPNPLGLHLVSDRALDGSSFGIPGVGSTRQLFIPDQTTPPGVPTGTFSSVWSLRDFHFNANGRVAFAADINGGGPGAQGGIWSDGRFGALQLIALSGAAAPGLSGPVFNTNAGFVLATAFSDNNCVVFQGQLLLGSGVGGGNDTGLWTTRSISTGGPGNLRLLVREGNAVPAGAGPDYEGLNFGQVSQFWVNAAGRVAFMNLHNDFTNAVWIENADGTLSPVVKEFTMLDVSGNGSDLRLITNIDLANITTGTGNGLRTAFNDNGDIALRIRFADGSEGIFTTAPAVACSAPVQTVAPQTQEVIYGSTVTLTVGSSGTGPIKHQWRHEGAPILNQISSQLTITINSENDLGFYDCVLTNACGSVISSTAVLTVSGFSGNCSADFNGDGDFGTDADIEAFFACLGGNCCASCGTSDFNEDGDFGTDADIESFFRVLAGGPC